jgi:hypothetical protein
MLKGRTVGKLLGLRAKCIRPFQLFDFKKLHQQSIEVRSKNVLPAYCKSSLWTPPTATSQSAHRRGLQK